MKRLTSMFIVLFAIVLLVASCNQKVNCNEPYISVGNECCLDKDKNKICDEDEGFQDNRNGDIKDGNGDSDSFSITAIKQTKCYEGTKTCEAGNTQVWTCRADGAFDKQDCDFGCTVDTAGIAKCSGRTEY